MIRRSHKFIAYILTLSLLLGTCSVPALAASNEGEQNTSAQTVTEDNTSSSDDSFSGNSSGNDDSGWQDEENGSSDSGNNNQGSSGQGDDQTGNGQDGSGEGQSGEFNPDEQGENGEFNPDDPNGDGLNQDGENLDGENPDGEGMDGEDLENGEFGDGEELDENSGEGLTQDGENQDGENQNGDQSQDQSGVQDPNGDQNLTGDDTGAAQAEEPVEKAKQAVSGKQSYTKRLGYDPFKIEVKTNGDGRLVYYSSNPKVISVSKSGKATVKGTGTAVISVYAEETELCQKSNVLRVTVKVLKKQQKVTGAASYTKSMGTDDFKIAVTKEGNGKLIYESSNKNVATVSASGKVTVKGVGAAKITVYAAETATCLQSTAKVITVKVGPEKTALTGITSSADHRTTIEWQQQENVSGYQIQYSDTLDFSKSKVVTAGAADTSKVISGIPDAAAYYVRVRAYQMQDGKRLFAEWSEPEEVGAKIQAASLYGNTLGSGLGISTGPSRTSSVASGSHHRLLLRLLQLREKSSAR